MPRNQRKPPLSLPAELLEIVEVMHHMILTAQEVGADQDIRGVDLVEDREVILGQEVPGDHLTEAMTHGVSTLQAAGVPSIHGATVLVLVLSLSIAVQIILILKTAIHNNLRGIMVFLRMHLCSEFSLVELAQSALVGVLVSRLVSFSLNSCQMASHPHFAYSNSYYCSLTLYGVNLANVEGFFGTSDPFIQIAAYSGSPGPQMWQNIFRSEYIPDTLNPKFAPIEINLDLLCKRDLDQPIQFSVFDWEETGKHQPVRPSNMQCQLKLFVAIAS